MTDDTRDRQLTRVFSGLETHFAEVSKASPGFGKLQNGIHGVLGMPGPFEGKKKEEALKLSVVLTRVAGQHAGRAEIQPLVSALPLITRHLAQ